MRNTSKQNTTRWTNQSFLLIAFALLSCCGFASSLPETQIRPLTQAERNHYKHLANAILHDGDLLQHPGLHPVIATHVMLIAQGAQLAILPVQIWQVAGEKDTSCGLLFFTTSGEQSWYTALLTSSNSMQLTCEEVAQVAVAEKQVGHPDLIVIVDAFDDRTRQVTYPALLRWNTATQTYQKDNAASTAIWREAPSETLQGFRKAYAALQRSRGASGFANTGKPR